MEKVLEGVFRLRRWEEVGGQFDPPFCTVVNHKHVFNDFQRRFVLVVTFPGFYWLMEKLFPYFQYVE